ncbi:hypothetical protein DUI87_27603 [Hirundo rustica rustica]|uniref:CCHC-type domain-containing protein n=1 Tax=Hirundo rustica rustica TaxID=333673 RepID=A0A3M0J3K5_HIRRU|nr:hypothetical protein DUI87_27603 [Hirundo rustica rustica]
MLLCRLLRGWDGPGPSAQYTELGPASTCGAFVTTGAGSEETGMGSKAAVMGSEMAWLLEAVDFAARKHKDQPQKDPEGTPYINHPISAETHPAPQPWQGLRLRLWAKQHHVRKRATIRDLCKAHQDYGRDSPYFRGLLRSDLEAAVVIPADLRQLFSCLMDSTEFKLWEAAWRQMLREALPSLLVDPEMAIDENGNALTLEHLMGEGMWTDLTDQASGIPIKALMVIREHAVTAFFSMVPDGPVIPYYKIIQGTKEAFPKFVERLTRAVEVQVSEVDVREGILREMVFANANNLCRTSILSLPLDPPPTIQDMLRVCQLKVPFMQGNDQDRKQKTPRVAAMSGTQQEHIRRPYAPQRNKCIICLEPGHWASNCPLREDIELL